MSRRTIVVFSILLIAFGVVSRFVPHMWNAVPITAIALAASAYVGFTYSVGIILVVMALSDISLGTYEWPIMLSVYGSFAVSAGIGLILKKHRTVLGVVSGASGASLVFFIVTNTAVWYFSGMYARTYEGLLQCFVAALPFFRGTFLGDILFTGLIFGLSEALYRLSRRSQARTVSV